VGRGTDVVGRLYAGVVGRLLYAGVDERFPKEPMLARWEPEFIAGWLARELKPAGGRGTLRTVGVGENPPRDCVEDSGARDCGMELIGGRGTLRAICG
jgi:hypothetical protein